MWRSVFYAIYAIAHICVSTKPVPIFSPSKINSAVVSTGFSLPQLRSGLPLDLFMQHFLNFFPLPQGQGAFLPTLCLFESITGGFSFGWSGLGESCFSFSRANRIKPTGSSPNSSIRRSYAVPDGDFQVCRSYMILTPALTPTSLFITLAGITYWLILE